MRPSSEAGLVEVALPLPIYGTFTYRVEGPPPEPGTRVLVPFRREERVGWVVGPGTYSGPGVRPVLDVLDPTPTVPADLLDLCRWMADYYAAPLGIALRAALPAVLSDASRDYLTFAGADTAGDLRPREARVLAAVRAGGGAKRVRTLRNALGMGSIWPEVRSLVARGLIIHETMPPPQPPVKKRRVLRLVRWVEDLARREELFGRAGRQKEAYEALEAGGGKLPLAHMVEEMGFSRGVLKGLEDKGLVAAEDEEVLRDPFAEVPAGPPLDLRPTAHQRAALQALIGGLDDGGGPPFLLEGVTGSGKTLVYIELLRAVLERGRSGIVLVPEISLTPQTVSRFRAHFGDQVAVLHSGLSAGERYDAWRRLRSGERRIAVGARSALFAPVAELGVVVVDEEHDGSYKQSDAPRYHARDLAVMRARANGAVCVLGSATPSMESWHNARTGKFRHLVLPERVGGARLPAVRVVDLRLGRRNEDGSPKRPGRGAGVLSDELVAAVDARLERGEQVILLLNRRGYASFVQCRECGDVEQCENCSISLTYHRVTQRIVCHHCRYEAPAPSRCTRCGSEDLSFRGVGTEQVERVAAESFPGARIARMDVDTTSGKWGHQRILDRVERGEVDILLGTQMIAKGLDFPRVTLVGVVNADVGIHLPDFRASERAFQLMSQVAGRAGRGTLGGEVLIQTSLPEHYAVRAAVDHDFRGFAERELEERRGPGYPPHVRMVNVILSSPDQPLAVSAAERAAAWVRGRLAASERAGRPLPLDLVGPAPAPIERLHGRWRWHFFVRSTTAGALTTVCKALAMDFELPAGDVRMAIDRDPVALL